MTAKEIRRLRHLAGRLLPGPWDSVDNRPTIQWMSVPLCESAHEDDNDGMFFRVAVHTLTAALPHLERLLDERDLLLAFAKRMDRTLDRHLYQAELADCAAAIAKAEAP